MDWIRSLQTDASSKAWHPYYPLHAPITNYVANEWSMFKLLATFFAACTVFFSVTGSLVKLLHPQITRADFLTVLWFTLSGSIHVIFEGYFVLNHQTLAADQSPVAQLWKEYALSDSRYLTSDTFVLCTEALTVMFWGPLCLAVAGCIVLGHPLRHPLQIIVSVAHLYGDALYFSTSLFDLLVHGKSHSRPEALYFWVYFVLFNAPWIIVPFILLYSSVAQCSLALRNMQAPHNRKNKTP